MHTHEIAKNGAPSYLNVSSHQQNVEIPIFAKGIPLKMHNKIDWFFFSFSLQKHPLLDYFQPEEKHSTFQYLVSKQSLRTSYESSGISHNQTNK